MTKIILRATGSQVPDDMTPGEYIVRCEKGEIKQKGNKVTALLTFSVLGKPTAKGLNREHEGVILAQWYFLAEVKDPNAEIEIDIKPNSKYGAAWALAAGRPLKRGENPAPTIFEKKIFRVLVGYRTNDRGDFSYRNAETKKDGKDFLRIHAILEIIEKKAPTDMTPYEPNEVNNNVIVNEHEHEQETQALAMIRTETKTKTLASGFRMNDKSKEQVRGHAIEGLGAADERLAPVPFLNSLFPGAKVVAEDKPLFCNHCNKALALEYERIYYTAPVAHVESEVSLTDLIHQRRSEIVKRIWPDGSSDWMCHACGRKARVERRRIKKAEDDENRHVGL